MSALGRSGRSPRSAAKPHERGPGPPRGAPVRPAQPSKPLEGHSRPTVNSFVRLRSDEWTTQWVVHRWTVAPGNGPGIRSCAATEGARRLGAARVAPGRGEAMSPLPGRRTERHDGRKVRNPMRAGSPETDQPILPFRDTSRPRRGETSSRPRVVRSAPRGKAAARTVGERALEGRTPGRPGAAVLTDPAPNPCREQGPVAECAAPPQGGGGRQRQEGRGPERGTAGHGGQSLEGGSPGTLRRFARR